MGVADAEVTRESHIACALLTRPSRGGPPRASTRTHSPVSSLLCSPTPSPCPLASLSLPLLHVNAPGVFYNHFSPAPCPALGSASRPVCAGLCRGGLRFSVSDTSTGKVFWIWNTSFQSPPSTPQKFCSSEVYLCLKMLPAWGLQ